MERRPRLNVAPRAEEVPAPIAESVEDKEQFPANLTTLFDRCKEASELASESGLSSPLTSPIALTQAYLAVREMKKQTPELVRALGNPAQRAEALHSLMRVGRPERRYDSHLLANTIQREAVYDILDKNLDALRPRWEEERAAELRDTIDLMEGLIEEAEANPKKKNRERIDRIRSVIAEDARSLLSRADDLLSRESGRLLLRHMAPLLVQGIKSSNPEESEAAGKLFARLLPERTVKRGTYASSVSEKRLERGYFRSDLGPHLHDGMVTEAFATLVEQTAWVWARRMKDEPGLENGAAVVRNSISSLGLDPETFISASKESTAFEEWNEALSADFLTAWKLDTLRKGGAKTLAHEFGIQAFSRYPVNFLVRQYDKKDIDVPYGVALLPRNDHNGAFRKNGNPHMFKQFMSEAGEVGYELRAYEAESGVGAMKHLIRADKKYGERNKISFALVSAHGNTDVVAFGKEKGKSKGRVRSRDLGERNRRLASLFISQPTIILDSCLVGSDKGFAETVSSLYGAEVLASSAVTSGIDDIDIEKDDAGRLHFKVRFNTEKGAERRYQKGKRVEIPV